MVVVAFGIIGFLILLLIYLTVRNQSIQRELIQYKRTLKATDSQARYAMKTLIAVSAELQKAFVARLEANQKRGIISGQDYEIAGFILNHVDFVISQCVEHQRSVEEAVNKALERSELSMKDINQYIANQASEIRVPWCKNAVNAFVVACNNISVGTIKTKSGADSKTPEAQASNA